jgi:hypothetical protein
MVAFGSGRFASEVSCSWHWLIALVLGSSLLYPGMLLNSRVDARVEEVLLSEGGLVEYLAHGPEGEALGSTIARVAFCYGLSRLVASCIWSTLGRRTPMSCGMARQPTGVALGLLAESRSTTFAVWAACIAELGGEPRMLVICRCGERLA